MADNLRFDWEYNSPQPDSATIVYEVRVRRRLNPEFYPHLAEQLGRQPTRQEMADDDMRSLIDGELDPGEHLLNGDAFSIEMKPLEE